MTEQADQGLIGRVHELRHIAAVLASVVAGIHLVHPDLGAPRLILHLQVGTLFDPRPLLFTVSGFLIIFGILLVYNGLFVRAVYAGGIVLMLSYILGYAAWHTVLGHGAFWPHIHGHGHHDEGFLEIIWIHLIGDWVAMISKLHELALLLVLTVLFMYDTRSDG